jgi:hypothetical protein
VSARLHISLRNIVSVPVVNTYNDILRCLNVFLVKNSAENGREMVEDVMCLADNLLITQMDVSQPLLNRFP